MNINFRSIFLTKIYWVPFIHFLSLLILSIFAFSYNPGFLLQGNDGPTNVSLAEAQAFLFGITPYLHGNFMEGIGNIFFPFNCVLQPGFWLVAHNNMSAISQAFLYTWFAFQLFLSVLLIGFNHNFSRQTCFNAAWLLTLIAFPYFSEWRLYPLTVNTPQYLNIITVFAIIDLGLHRMGKQNWLISLGYGALVVLGVMVGLMLCPAHVLLIVPMLLASLIYSLFHLSHREEFKRKIIICVGLILFFILSGWLEYFLGLMLNTAAVVFYSDLEHIRPSLLYVSILYHWNLPGAKLGPIFFSISLVAIVYSILKIPKFKFLAITVLIMECLIVIIGTILTLVSTSWSLPEPIYFEMLLLPFFALFSVHVCEYILKQKRWPLFKFRYSGLFPFFFAILIMLVIRFEVPHTTQHQGFHLVPHSTSVTKVLEQEIGLHKNFQFRGRVANILLHKGFLDQLNYFAALDLLTGNDHQSTGLWLKHIPTLHEYNQLLTPSFYFLYRRFLSDSLKDKPYRSWSNFSIMNAKILQLLGVKFVLTDTNHIPNGYYRTKLETTNNISNLYLFELMNPNISGISARTVITSNGIKQAAQYMDDPSFNIQDAVVTNKKFNPSLVKAEQSSILLDPGGIRIKASSRGISLLILPMEYSHCLHMNVLSGSKPKLLRVDIALTGLLFKNKIEVVLDNRLSLFDNPRCRLKDYLEFLQLWKK